MMVVTKIESVGKDLNFRVYILAIAAFVVGTVELIIGGTLDLVANDLGVSIRCGWSAYNNIFGSICLSVSSFISFDREV